MSWFRAMGFVANPYGFLDPLEIPPERIEWNRKDLDEQRRTLNDFLTDAEAGERSGLLAIGAIGSGKTWLSRVIEGEYREKVKNGIVLRTKLGEVQPDFAAVFFNFIESVLAEPQFLKSVSKQVKKQSEWAEFFEEKNVGMALYHIHARDHSADVAKNWIRGSSVSSTEMKEAQISLKLDSNSYRARVMRILIQRSVDLFPGTLFLVDELENASPSLARGLADVLRDLMDAYVEKFSLCCFITAQRVDEWYDHGYSEALLSRLQYQVNLDPIRPAAAPDWLREHHKVYREKGKDVKDPLEPFTVEGIKKLLEMMPPTIAYPRYIFRNCSQLARDAYRAKKTEIDGKFVESEKGRLELRETTRG